MLPQLDALPPLNLSGGDSRSGSVTFGGINFSQPNQTGALMLAGLALAAFVLWRSK
jgi:hypothetical protein